MLRVLQIFKWCVILMFNFIVCYNTKANCCKSPDELKTVQDYISRCGLPCNFIVFVYVLLDYFVRSYLYYWVLHERLQIVILHISPTWVQILAKKNQKILSNLRQTFLQSIFEAKFNIQWALTLLTALHASSTSTTNDFFYHARLRYKQKAVAV